MPLVRVYGMPIDWLRAKQPFDLEKDLQDAIYGVQGLGLSGPGSSSVFVVRSHNERGLEEWSGDVMVEIGFLFDTENRTEEVINRLALVVAQAIAQFAYARTRSGSPTPWKMVEVLIGGFGKRDSLVATWLSNSSQRLDDRFETLLPPQSV